MNLAVDLCGVRLRNPVIAASGCFGFGEEFGEYCDLTRLGGISMKALTAHRREGNPPPRIAETPSGILNSVGLQNPGIDAFLSDLWPKLRDTPTTLIANVAGSTIPEYCEVLDKLAGVPIPLIELNISCPNVKEGGVAFGRDPAKVLEVVRAVRSHCKQKLIVKLSPNVADIREAALAAQEGGADAVSLINTLTGMAIDVHTRKPILANVTGGLSGPAVRPVALRMVYEVAQAVSIPVVGMGGILTGEDAVAFLLAGATAVMVGTANLADPAACNRVVDGLETYLAQYGIQEVGELVGALR